jgi:hypothetical protein
MKLFSGNTVWTNMILFCSNKHNAFAFNVSCFRHYSLHIITIKHHHANPCNPPVYVVPHEHWFMTAKTTCHVNTLSCNIRSHSIIDLLIRITYKIHNTSEESPEYINSSKLVILASGQRYRIRTTNRHYDIWMQAVKSIHF